MVYFTCFLCTYGSIPPFYVLNVCVYVYNIRWSNLFEKYIRLYVIRKRVSTVLSSYIYSYYTADTAAAATKTCIILL